MVSSKKEIYSLVVFLQKWKNYFYHRDDTIIYTDALTVKLLLENQKTSNKLQRWKMLILQYNIKVKHMSSFRNSIADYISRTNNPFIENNSKKILNINDKKLLTYITDPKQQQLGLKDLKKINIEDKYKINLNGKQFKELKHQINNNLNNNLL